MNPATLEEASSPNTTTRRLQEIAKHLPEEPAAQPLVAALLRNPNSPLKLLIALSPKDPTALIDNVGLPLLLIEDPNFFSAFPSQVATALVKESSTPMWLVEACYRGHCQANSASSALFVLLAKRPELSPFLVEQLSLCEHREALLALLHRADLPAPYVERLLYSPLQAVRVWAAKHQNAPGEKLQELRRAGASFGLDAYQTPDPSVSADELNTLLSRGLFASRVAVRHPNFPVDVLPTLLVQRNELVSSALKNPKLPDALLAPYQKSYRGLIAKHPNASAETLLSLLILGEGYDLPTLQRTALQHPSTPPRFAQLWRQTEEKDPSLTAQDLQEFASYGGCPRRMALSHPNAPESLLQAVCREMLPHAHRDRNDLLLLIAQHPNTPLEALEALARLEESDQAKRVRTASCQIAWTAMAHPRFPREQLLASLQDAISQRVFDKVQDLLRSPHSTPQLFASALLLASGKDWYSRQFLDVIVQDPRLSASELRPWVSSRRWKLRAALARHPNTAPSELQRLAEDAIPKVRLLASKHPALPASSLQALIDLGATPDLFGLSCRRVEVSDHQLKTLITRGPFVRMLAAKACGAGQIKTLEILANDRHVRVREAAAKNPHLSKVLRNKLSASSNCYTRASLAQNPNATAEDLGMETRYRHDGNLLLQKALASHPNTPPKRLRELSEATNTSLEVAQNPNAPIECLEKLSASKFLPARRAVILNPNTPKTLLQKLLQKPLTMPLETARLRLEIATAKDRERDLRALLPVFQSNPDFLALDEGKRDFSLEDAQRYFQETESQPNGLIFLIYRRDPLSTRRDQGPEELRRAGEELIATACSIDQHPREPYPWLGLLLLHSQCHRQGLGQEVMVAIERFFYSRGFRELRLAAFQENKKAVSFWNSLGYQRYEEATHKFGKKLWKLRKELIF